ncbi:hypothetical protein [Geothrix sp. PMB-07]|uniref:hypothetical protein n=1 Tax=Geothrix sp. PMB-07 TaxID=3068640 RepID=UPI0027412A60|nr:hypothetical protein [Geothrix sp. PMB-07]WLT32591.1 hypothetical protein Q9293_04490 [Geothrix sp. PMB-07]
MSEPTRPPRPWPPSGLIAEPMPPKATELVGLARELYDRALAAPCLSPSQRREALADAEGLTRLLGDLFQEGHRSTGLRALKRAVDLRLEIGRLERAPGQTFGASMPKVAHSSLVGP